MSTTDLCPSFVIFTCTWYRNTEDLRFQQCLETIRLVGEAAVSTRRSCCPHLVIVDGSPSIEVQEELLTKAAAATNSNDNSIVTVYRQTYEGGKGAALREAAYKASLLPGIDNDTFFCWQEPEKTSMILCWINEVFPFVYRTNKKNNDVAEAASVAVDDDGAVADVIVPYRDDSLFKDSYPIEQYHSEMYGNFYLDCVMKEALPQMMKQPQQRKVPAKIDWHFGPFAFQAKHVQLWTTYTMGKNSYDAQLVPIVHGIRRGLTIVSTPVHFQLDPKMKEQEEGNVVFIEKRIQQLNELDPMVKQSWTNEFYCESTLSS